MTLLQELGVYFISPASRPTSPPSVQQRPAPLRPAPAARLTRNPEDHCRGRRFKCAVCVTAYGPRLLKESRR